MIIHYAALAILLLAISIRLDFILGFFKFLSLSFIGGDDSEKTTLFVGVLSAPPNTAARRAIRETWGQLKNNRSIELKFLIGEELCPYPPEDRIAPYGCNLWLVNNPRATSEYSTVGDSIRSDSCNIGFTFMVKSSIWLTQIGVDSIVFSGNTTDKARVALFDNKTGRKVTSATFAKEPVSGFIWKPISHVILDEGFQGELKLIDAAALQTRHCNILLQYVAPVYYLETLDAKNSYTKHVVGNFRPALVGMNYKLKEEGSLANVLVGRVQRFNKWSLITSLVKQQLEDEQKKYGDLLFLSGFIDVYDNLSFKISVFFDWVIKLDQWKFILKTDDDVFVDLALVEKGLNEFWDLWTCMRTQSPNHWGKWRDRGSISYPPFPSGSGYVLSMETVKALQLNPREKLGEDVMIGMGLEGSERIPLDAPCCWACGAKETTCDSVCNTPELTSGQMRKLWEIYIEMGRIPNFDEM